VGDRDFQTKTFTVELRVDPTLEAGKFRVQHLWDNDSGKTVVTPRKPQVPAAPETKLGDASTEPEEDATIVRPRAPKEKLFSVSVTRNTPDANGATPSTPDTRPFYKNAVTIGRGSKQVAVDLCLEGDLEVSRKHATLNRLDDRTFTITCQGSNPIVLDGGKEVPAGETATVKTGETIAICSYELKIVDDKPINEKDPTPEPSTSSDAVGDAE